MKSRELIAAAVSNGVEKFVFSSTSAVYGIPDKVPVSEDTPLNPMSPYGASKAMTERMLTDSSLAYGLRSVALRYFNVAGADPMGRVGQSTRGATHLIKVACETALGKRSGITVYGTDYPTADGTCVRDYIHVTDLARGHSAALKHLRNGGGNEIFNCGYGHGSSVREVIETVKRVSGRDFKVEYAARRPGDPATIVADASRIRMALGWLPQFDDLDVIVRHALAWETQLIDGR